MRKYLPKIILVIFLLLVAVRIADAVKFLNYSFPFIGRWQGADEPLMIDDYGLQDVRNMRRYGKLYRGVKGHTAINTTAFADSEDYSETYTAVGGAPTYATWNPADESNNLTYSNGNLTVTRGSNGGGGNVRATIPITTSVGKTYWEVICDNDGGASSSNGFGHCSLTTNLGAPVGGAPPQDGKSLNRDGIVHTHGGTQAYSSGFENGDTIGVAYNPSSKLTWFTDPDGTWNGDPVAGTGSAFHSEPMATATQYPLGYVLSAGSQYTANFGASDFAHSAPSGYSPGVFFDRIDVTNTSIDVYKLDRDEEVYVYRDLGAGTITGDFRVQFEFNITAASANGVVAVLGASNEIDDLGNPDADKQTTAFTVYDDYVGILAYYSDGTSYTQAGTDDALSTSTTYYATAGIASTGGVWGKGYAYFYVYSDSARTAAVDTLGISFKQSMSMRYIYAMSGLNTSAADHSWTGSISNLRILNYSALGTKNAFHFKKSFPVSETHVLIQSGNDTNYTEVYQNTTAIPDAGDFATQRLYSEVSGAKIGRFSNAPQGNMLYADSKESLIWGGDEIYPIQFITSTEKIGYTVTNAKDYTDQVTNNLDTPGEIARIGGGNDSKTKLLLHFDGTDGSATMADSSASAHGNASVYSSAQLDVDMNVFGTASLKLEEATADMIAYSPSTDFDFGTGRFTIGTWVTFDTVPGVLDQACFWQQYQDGNNFNHFYYSGTIGAFTVNVQTGGGAYEVSITRFWVPEARRPYHIALIRGWNDDNDTWAITVDGTIIGSAASDADSFTMGATANVDLQIGRLTTAAAEYAFSGWIDEYRVTKGVARWNANFAVPSRAYSQDALYWLVGSPRPIQGVKYYLASANAESATIAVWQWAGSSWSALTPVTDNTSGLSVDESATAWPSTVNTAEQRYFEGLSLYWYQFQLSNGMADIYQVTVDAPFQKIHNIWDGAETVVAGCKVYTTTIEDYTDEVNDDTTSYVAVLDDLPATSYMLLGFVQPMQGFNIRVPGGKENSNASVLTTSFWNGDAWESLRAVADGTSYSGGASIGSSGVVVFTPPDEGVEYPKQEDEGLPLYWYKLAWSASLDSETEIYYITGIPATKEIEGYNFPAMFQGRSFLFKENKAIYSAYNAPYVWSGDDTGILYFGSNTDIVAAIPLYNLYRTTGYEQLLVFKKNATFRLFGDGPDNWQIQQMSGNVGITAPLSLAACEIADIGKDTKRLVVVWQSDSGVMMSDGATIIPISDDVRHYWDSTDNAFIPTNRQDDSFGWYDTDLGVYKLLISSGSGQTTHNVELEFSLKYREWTKLYRENSSGANPLQAGLLVHDTDGSAYSYGFSDDGYMYRLENGKTWNGTAIDQHLHTKDVMLDPELPFFKKTTLKYLRMINTAKAGGENYTVTHYGDGLASTTTGNQKVPAAYSMASDYFTRSVLLGPFLRHSFKVEAEVSAVDDGLELQGLGVLFESSDRIHQQ